MKLAWQVATTWPVADLDPEAVLACPVLTYLELAGGLFISRKEE